MNVYLFFAHNEYIYIYTYFNVPLGFSVSNVTNSSDHTKADPHEQVVDGKDASMIQHNADETQQRREQTNDTCGCNDYRYVVYVSKCMFLYMKRCLPLRIMRSPTITTSARR